MNVNGGKVMFETKCFDVSLAAMTGDCKALHSIYPFTIVYVIV